MVSVELLFRVQVLLDVIVHALFPVGIGDFYDSIYKTKKKYIHLLFNHSKEGRSVVKIQCGGVSLHVAEGFVAYSCGVRVVHCRRV